MARIVSFFDGWDRTFLDLSSRMSEPFCRNWELLRFRITAPLDPQKFDNCVSRAGEIAIRTIIILGVAITGYCSWVKPFWVLGAVGGLAAGSKILRKIGFYLQPNGYTHVRGNAPEKSSCGELKIMSWNVCGVGGGLSLNHGGVIHWRSRLNGIVEQIKREDPDVLMLQEIYDTALAEALIEKLQKDYAHFFIHLGGNLFGSVGGGMVLSKCAQHRFFNISFANNHWSLNRGFAVLEIKKNPQDSLPCLRIIGTHFIHGDRPEDQLSRNAQMKQIGDFLAREAVALPTILCGDLNIERDGKEGDALAVYLHRGYQGKEPTCTNRLVAQWSERGKGVWGETIDYISFFKSSFSYESSISSADQDFRMQSYTESDSKIGNRRKGNAKPPQHKLIFEPRAVYHLIKAFDDSYNTKTALSDHHGIVAVVKINNMSK